MFSEFKDRSDKVTGYKNRIDWRGVKLENSVPVEVLRGGLVAREMLGQRC